VEIRRGERFTKLVVLEPDVGRDKRYCRLSRCLCDCGNVVIVAVSDLMRGHTKSCGCLKKEKARDNWKKMGALNGENNPRWKGGRRIHEKGYIRIYRPEHPHADCVGYVFEHRLIMEKKLGRLLRPKEVVHHIDGDKANNAEENLDLFADQGKHANYHKRLEQIAEET